MTRRALPPLRLLTTFETVLRTGGVRNAAAELNVTQPAVSQALRGLEDHIGAPLLDRRTRPATLTEAGRTLFLAVSGGLDQIGGAVDRIRAATAAGQNVVTVACTLCTGTYWLMPRLATFYDRYPDVTVRVVTSSGMPQFATDTDLAIRYGDGAWGDGTSELLFRERLVPVCSPRAVARFGVGDLAKAPLLHVDAEDEDWDAYFAAIGEAAPRRDGRTFGNHVQATQAAIAGVGVMLGWISNTGDLVKEGRLAIFCDQPITPAGAFYLVSGARAKPAARLLAAHLRDCAA